jgi:hypothetical protein
VISGLALQQIACARAQEVQRRGSKAMPHASSFILDASKLKDKAVASNEANVDHR